MKRALLVLALLLVATQAHATSPRLAIFTQPCLAGGGGHNGFPTQEQYNAFLQVLDMTATPYTVFNASLRTWGATSKDDSVWFREQGYEAAVVLAECAGAGGVPTSGGYYGSRFQNAAGAARIQEGPLSGLWGIPTYVISASVAPTTSYDPDLAGSNNRYIAGITHTTPSGTFGKPGSDSIGTWRYKMLARISGDRIDTLYTDPQSFGCRPATWAGSGTVAALAWPDTLINAVGGFASCVQGDTAASVWRYRPLAGRPGVTFFTTRQEYTGGYNLATLWILQNIFTVTQNVRPMARVLIPIMEHDAEAGDETNAVSRANQQRLNDTLRVRKVARWVASPMNPDEYASFYNAATLTTIRRGFSDDLTRWHPFSYGGAIDWQLRYYAASDTLGVRQRWNQVMNTTSHADSGGFAKNRMNLSRIVSGQGVVGGWTTKVLADAGVKIVETTLDRDRGDLVGWALIGAMNSRTTGSIPVHIPGVSESRIIYAQGLSGFGHGATFTALSGGAGAGADYVGGSWINAIGVASSRRTSLYWHTGGGSGVGNQDPYFSWLMSYAARYVGYFDKVIDFDRSFSNQVFTVRRSFNARY